MAQLKYWDATLGQYVVLPGQGGQAVAYAPVQATAPNAAAPALSPPMGFLWIDTSTSAPGNLPYYPPQQPPASGFNSFIDSSGEVWVSLNGTAWKKAKDVLHARVTRGNTNFTFTGTSWVPLPYDTISHDTYGMYRVASQGIVAPIGGVYRVSGGFNVTVTAALQYLILSVYVNGVQGGSNSQWNPQTSGGLSCMVTDTMWANTGDTVCVYGYCSGALVSNGDPHYNFASFDYMGTG